MNGHQHTLLDSSWGRPPARDPSSLAPMTPRDCEPRRPMESVMDREPRRPMEPVTGREAFLRSRPEDQSATVWDEAETDFWDQFDRQENNHLSMARQRLQAETNRLTTEINSMADRCRGLSAVSENLTKKVAATDAELAKVREAKETAMMQLNSHRRNYENLCQQTYSTRASVALQMTNFFRSKKGLEPITDEPDRSRASSSTSLRPAIPEMPIRLAPIVDQSSAPQRPGTLPKLDRISPHLHPSPRRTSTPLPSTRWPQPQNPDERRAQLAMEASAGFRAAREALPESKPQETHLPTPKESESNGFTPANRQRQTSDELTSSVASPRPSPNLAATSMEPGEEITAENCVLRHNGEEYTYPECMAGVPVRKINPSHPYWEASWPDPAPMIQTQLDVWKEKHSAVISENKPGSAKYQVGRQVNRGKAILEWLSEGEISPYQLLGKRYVHSGKGSIVSYDTLFRLADTLADLSKFKLSVTPVEWLRHRLWEILQEEGYAFSLSKTMHDFYADPKLAALRAKHGFKNIGRPAGTGLKKNRTSVVFDEPVVAGSPKRKRQETEESQSRPTSSPRFADSILASDPESPGSPVKRSRNSTPVGDGPLSFTVERIMTRSHASPENPRAWKWDPSSRKLSFAEAEMEIFDIDVRDITMVSFSQEGRRIQIDRTSERASERIWMATFDTLETRAAFVRWCQGTGVKTLQTANQFLDASWERFQPGAGA